MLSSERILTVWHSLSGTDGGKKEQYGTISIISSTYVYIIIEIIS